MLRRSVVFAAVFLMPFACKTTQYEGTKTSEGALAGEKSATNTPLNLVPNDPSKTATPLVGFAGQLTYHLGYKVIRRRFTVEPQPPDGTLATFWSEGVGELSGLPATETISLRKEGRQGAYVYVNTKTNEPPVKVGVAKDALRQMYYRGVAAQLAEVVSGPMQPSSRDLSTGNPQVDRLYDLARLYTSSYQDVDLVAAVSKDGRSALLKVSASVVRLRKVADARCPGCVGLFTNDVPATDDSHIEIELQENAGDRKIAVRKLDL